VVADQGGEHRAVVVGVEDALHDRVVAAGEGEAGGLVDEVDVRAAGNVALAQDDSSQVVLTDDRQVAPAVPGAYRRGCRGLAGCGVAPDHDQLRGTRGIAAGVPDARAGGHVSPVPGRRGVALPRPAELGAGLRGGEREQFRGQDPGVLGDARHRGDTSLGEPADLVFRFPDGAGAGSGGDVDVVFVNVRLAGVPVRRGAPFGDQPGRGQQAVGEPGRDRGGGSGNQGDVQAGLLQGLANAALRGGLVRLHVTAGREPAFKAGMPYQGGHPAALAVVAENEHT